MAKTIIFAALSLLLVGAIIAQPDASFQASLKGLTVWWNLVFPGLLPFLILFEIMLAFGLAHGMGVLLQPSMKRLFNLPGEAVMPVVIGWLGGYPAGAEAVASLRKRELVNRSQGQRLLALAHMPNPLFMLVIVGAGFLQKPLAGMFIAGGVWLSAIWLTLLGSIWRGNRSTETTTAHSLAGAAGAAAEENGQRSEAPQGSLLRQASDAMLQGRISDGRSLGKVLGDSVTVSVQRLMMVGGFMIIASMTARLTEPLFAPALKLGLSFLGPALFEGHLGAYAAAVWELPGTDLAMVCAVIAAALAWGGLSGVMQAGYSVSGTDLSLFPFVLHRLNHALHAFMLTLLLWHPAGALVRLLNPNVSFPVIWDGFYYDSSSGIRFQPETIAASNLPSLWPYGAVIAVGLGLLTLCMYWTLGRFAASHKGYRT
ncbi:nucleoside recognition domain-containing protein [Paenibacillus sp. PAMC21692]|uniref:nucleoside recognition domain-containing protein n=1 Tax=Paenibacillus sp. PAMC21692 TaxID=2762320 RepID=UPI00164E6EE9|nr:nucleoside recognition domain-containing protein [Paenibacillus sp. PAMC21692]QNK54717.1 nucleoside recognition domain-containing protein [Paenibacillus sp. PAMC21692]